MTDHDHPVCLDAVRPARYDRAQLVIRFLVMLCMAVVGTSFGWLFWVLYFGLPLFAAVGISQRGARYLDEFGPRLVRFLRWVVALYAYLGLVTDRLPLAEQDLGVTLTVAPHGTPTVRSALWRLLWALPYAFILCLLSVISAFVWIYSALCVLIQSSVPDGAYSFQLGVLRWQARLLAFLASLVDEPPSFSLIDRPAPAGGAT